MRRSSKCERSGDTYRVAATGELDLSSASQLEDAFDAAAASNAPVILVDLSRVTWIGSIGLRVLLRMRSRCGAKRLRFVLSPACEQLLDLTAE
jgi:anti-sigma B factor antagonist